MLSSIPITADFQQISDEYKRFKHLMHDEMCESDQQSLDQIEKKLLKTISSLLQDENPKTQEDNRIRALIGIMTLSKYSIINQEECANLFSKIETSFPQSTQKRLFFFMCIAKLSKKSPNYLWDKYLKEVLKKILPMKKMQPDELGSIENALIYIHFLVKYAPNFLSTFSKEIILHLLRIVKNNNYVFDSNYNILAKTGQTFVEYFSNNNEKFYANNAIDLIKEILVKIKSIRYQMLKVNNILVSEQNKKLKYLALLSALLQTCDKSFIELNLNSIHDFLDKQENNQEMQYFIARNLIYCLKDNELPDDTLYNCLFTFNDDLSPLIICGKLQNLKLLVSLNHHGIENQRRIYELALNYINDKDDSVRVNAFDLLNTLCMSINEEDKMNFDFETVLTENKLEKNILQFNELINLKLDYDPQLFVDELSQSIQNDTRETLQFLSECKATEEVSYVIQNLKDNTVIKPQDLNDKIIQPIAQNIENEDDQIRSLVPLVMSKICPIEFFSDNNLQAFIRVLLKDPNNKVKLSILQSFNHLFALDNKDINYNNITDKIDSIGNIFDSFINDNPSQEIQKESIKFVCHLSKLSDELSQEILNKFKDLYSELSSQKDYSIIQQKMANNSDYLPLVIDALPEFYNKDFESFFQNLFGFMNYKIQSKTLFQLNFYDKIFCSYTKIFKLILRKDPTLIEPHINELIEFCMKCLHFGLNELETQNILSLLEQCLYHIGLEKTIEINNKKVFDEQTNLYKIVFNTGTHFISPSISKLIFKILGFIGVQSIYEKPRIINLETGWRTKIKYEIDNCKYISSRKNVCYAICSDLLYKILDDECNSNLHIKTLQILLNVLSKSDVNNSLIQSELEIIFKMFRKMLDNCSNDMKSEFVPFLKLFVDFGLQNIKGISHDLIECLIELFDYGSSSLLIDFATTLKVNFYPYLNKIIPKVLQLDDRVNILASLQVNCIIIKPQEALKYDIIKMLIDMVNEGKYEALQGLNEIIPSAYNIEQYIPSIINVCLKTISDSNSNIKNNNNNIDDDDEYYYEEEEEEETNNIDKVHFNDAVKVLQTLSAKCKIFHDCEIIFKKNFNKISKSLSQHPKEIEAIKNATLEKKKEKGPIIFKRRSIAADCKKDMFLELVTSIKNVISSNDSSIHVQQWLNELILFCIQESPSPIVKNMLPIVQINPSYSLSIFNIAFFLYLSEFNNMKKSSFSNITPVNKPKSNSKNSSQTFISITNDDRLLAKVPQVKKNGLKIVDGSPKDNNNSGMAIQLQPQIKPQPQVKTLKEEIRPITDTFIALFKMDKLPSRCRTILSNLVEFLDRAGIPIFDLSDFKLFERPLSTIFSNNPPLSLRFSLMNYMKYKNRSEIDKLKEEAATDLEQATTDLEQAYLNNGFYEQYQNFRSINQSITNEDENYLIPIQANTAENIHRLSGANRFFNEKRWDQFNNEINLCDCNSISHLFKAASLIQRYWKNNSNEQNENTTNDLIYDYANHSNAKSDNNYKLKLQILNEINKGFNSLGNENQASFSHLTSSINQSIIYGQQLVELQELFFSNGDLNNFMLRFMDSDQISKLLHPILLLRIASKDTFKNSLAEKIGLLSVCRKSMNWELMNKYYNHFFNSTESDAVPVEISYEMMYNKLVNGDASESDINSLLNKVQALAQQNKECCLNGEYVYANLAKYVKYQKALYYSYTFNEASKFKEVLSLCQDFDNSKAINLWSWANLKLFEIENGVDYFKPKRDYKAYKIKLSKKSSKNDGLEAQNTNSLTSFNKKEIDYTYLLNAIKGYIKSESMNNEMIGPNMVLIISLLFNYLSNKDCIKEIQNELLALPLYFYLESVPIIISYIHQIKKNDFGSFIIDLLIKLMEKYPRGVIYEYSFSLICDKRKRSADSFILSPIEDVKQYFLQNPNSLIEHNCQNIFNEVEDLTNNLNTFSNDIIMIITNFLKYVLDFLEKEFSPNSKPHQDNEIGNFIDDLNFMKKEYFEPLTRLINNEKTNENVYNPNIIEQTFVNDGELKESLKRLPSTIDNIIFNLNKMIDYRSCYQEMSQMAEKMEKAMSQNESKSKDDKKPNQKPSRLTFSENPQNLHLKMLEKVDSVELNNEINGSDSLSIEGTMSYSSKDEVEVSFPHIFVENDPNKILRAKLIANQKDYDVRNKEFKLLASTFRMKLNQVIKMFVGSSSICEHLEKLRKKLRLKIPTQNVTHDLEQENPEMYKKFQNLSLPMFGTFRYNESEPVLIKKFDSEYTEFKTLARPKKIKLLGSDGNEYVFMLKSTEDLRVDQRNMILFRFMNRFLKTKIRTYSVTPLTVQIGVMQFVQQTKSVSDLVEENRNRNNIEINENILICANHLQENEDFDELCNERKLIIFNDIIDKTPNLANDLSESMYYSAPNTQTWAKYTLNFTKTCAVTSIVGYIIGIGDRHNGNILVDMTDGSIVHIDFTDCFEINQRRSKYPEKVPFRLTRNFISMLGPCGYDGTFRSTCEETLALIRENREMIFNILEVFYISPIQTFGAVRDMRRNLNEVKLTSSKNKFIMKRIKMKLDGTDSTIIYDESIDKSKNEQAVSVSEQVNKLISHATSADNLSCSFSGWQPWI